MLFLLDLFFANKNSFNVRTQTALFVNVKNTTAKLSFSVRNFKLLRHTCNKFFYYCIILSAEYRYLSCLLYTSTIYEDEVTFIISCPIDTTDKVIAEIINMTNAGAVCEKIDKKYVDIKEEEG